MKRKTELKEGEIIPLTFDYVFTGIFNNKRNIPIIENFISCYLEEPLEKIKGHIELLPRELELESKKARNKQVDLILDLNGEKINIELSNRVGEGIINRNIVYACNIHGRQLSYGDNSYRRIKKTIQINLNNVHTNKKFIEKYYLRNEDNELLTEKIEIDVVDMEIGRRLCYTEDETKLARWCLVFSARDKKEMEEALEGLMEEETKSQLKEEVEKYSRDDEVIALYSAYTREELERNTFIEEARAEGIEQGILQVATEMLQNKMDVDLISKITGLSVDKIQSINE